MSTMTGTPRLPAWLTTSVAVLSGLLALGVGHLASGFVGAGASPYFAVGNAAIDLTPAWLKDFAVRTFGTYDKLVLLLGMAATIVAFLVAAGLLSRRDARPGMLMIAALGTVGTIAVFTRPDVGLLGPLAGVAATVAGVVAFRLLHDLARRTLVEPGARAPVR
ncbi:MAG TPA: molybdopterin-binding protein, partial [Pseudonocardiaceae bacterium]